MRKLVDDLERPLPDTVWWCENGHPDLLHRASALDFCMTCRDGACELRATTVSGGKRRSRKYPGLIEQPTTIAAAVTPVPLPPDFPLSDDQREQLTEGRYPGLAFPKASSGWLDVGTRYAVDDRFSILVTGLVEEKFSFGVRYELLRDTEVVVAEEFNPHADALPQVRRGGWIDKSAQKTYGSEPEPEPISEGAVQRMTDDTRAKRIEDLRASLKEAEAHVKNLEQRHPGKSRLFWPVKENIKRISKELATEENVARDLPPMSSEIMA